MPVETTLVFDEIAAGATLTSKPIRATGSAIGVALDVTAVSGGTPTLDVAIQWSGDGEHWDAPASAQTMTQATGATVEVKRFDSQAGMFRAVATIAGTTPAFTFTLNVTQFG